MTKQSNAQVRLDLEAGKAAVANAQQARAIHRRRSFKGGQVRRAAMNEAIKRCALAAKPIRAYIGMLPSHPELAEFDFELRAVSTALTAERRRLRKMLPDKYHRSRGE